MSDIVSEMGIDLMLNDNETQFIESFYGLVVKNSSFLGEGSGNTNYCIDTDAGRFVLSIIEEQSREEVELMAKTLEWLENNLCKTSLLIKPREQDCCSIVLRGKPTLLRTYMEGEVRQDFNENMLRELGAAMAQLHEIPPPEFLQNSLFYEQKKFMASLEANIDQVYESWVKDRLKALDIKNITGLPTSVIHSDLFYDNMLFNGEQFTCMIDFELACIYHSVFDIAMAIVGTCNAFGVLSVQKSRYLLSGYNAKRALKESEIKVLKSYTEYAAILTSLWRYWRYKIYQPGDEKSNHHLEMVNLAKSIQQTDFAKIVDVLESKKLMLPL